MAVAAKRDPPGHADSLVALVDWRDSVRFDGDQLHRSADAFHPRAISQTEYHWTNTDYANIAIAFRVAYSIGQTVCGRLIDRVGTRRGLTISVTWYSIVSLLTPLASGIASFAAFRFLLGAGESANWPGASKAVSEWFPNRERGSGGGVVRQRLVRRRRDRAFRHTADLFALGMARGFCHTRAAGIFVAHCLAQNVLPPQEHPRISDAERQMILADRPATEANKKPLPRWRDLLKLPQTWGTIVSKGLTDPVWFFVTDWFPIYLIAKGISLQSGLIAVWLPFLAADLGNFFGGGVSGYLIRRGWPLGAARKALVVFGGVGVMLLIPTIFTVNLYLITLLFGLATFSYASFSTIANVLPTDLYSNEAVASVSGMSGTGAGIGTIIAFELIGHFSDARQAVGTHSFDPIVIAAGLIPFIGMILVLLLVRNTRATDQGLVRRI